MGRSLLRCALRCAHVHADMDLRRRHCRLPDYTGSLHLLQVHIRTHDVCWLYWCHCWLRWTRKPDANWGSSVDAFTFNSAISNIQVLHLLKIFIPNIHQYFPGDHWSSRTCEKLQAQDTGMKFIMQNLKMIDTRCWAAIPPLVRPS